MGTHSIQWIFVVASDICQVKAFPKLSFSAPLWFGQTLADNRHADVAQGLLRVSAWLKAGA